MADEPAPAIAATQEEEDMALFGMPAAEYFDMKRVKHETQYFTTKRGVRLFTQGWLPADKPPSALYFMIHGATNDSSWLIQLLAADFVSIYGLAVFALDLHTHGRSEGEPRCYIPSLPALAHDCHDFLSHLQQQERFQGLKTFIYGESLGGGIAVLLVSQHPSICSGITFLSPLLRIAPERFPPLPVFLALKMVALFHPTAAWVPDSQINQKSFRDPARYTLTRKNPRRYGGAARLGTALELLRACTDIEAALPNIEVPFIVLHGESDQVTDPEASKLLHEVAASKDKTLTLVPDAWHQLLFGEVKEVRERLFKEVGDWIAMRIRGNELANGEA